MSLQVWLPLTGDLHNQGLSNIIFSNNNATIDNNGKLGKCYSFNGSNSYLKSTYNFYNNKYSVCAWIYSTSSSTTQTICCDRTAVGSGFSIFLIGGKLRIDAGGNNLQWTTNYTYPTNTWFHLTITYDGTNVFYYINGEYKEKKAQAISSSYWGTITSIGASQANGNTLGNYLNGKLNDVRIYDHALSIKEVEEISKGLVLHYKLAGSTVNLNTTNPNILTGTYYNSYKSGLAAGTTATNATGKWTGGSGGNGTFSVTYDETCPVGVLSWNVLNNTSGNRDFQQGDQPYISGQKYTTSFWAKGNGNCLYRSWNTTDGKAMFSKTWALTSTWTYYTYTFTASAEMETDSCTFHLGVSGNANINICGMKMELGTVATPWCPAESEIESLGFNQDIAYDCSGYGHNGIIDNTSIVSDTARYNNGAKFNGSSSYIKINDNTWMAQHAPEMTINLWAKNSTWATNTHFFSCTETGGFNTEAGNSGYLRFPIYVCTNAEQTTYAYKYDSKEIQISALPIDEWVMLTWVYDTTGTRTYINGELHHTYTNTSYGIRFNLNARLFLGCEAGTANPTTPYFNGQESDFRLYYTALTEDQIKELYNTSATIDKDGNIYVREFDTINTTSNPNITKTGIMKPVNIIQERDEQLASIEKNNNILGGHFYEY